MHIWKTLKVFVSSTFKDLELERDQLAQVFQNIKEKIFARQLTLIPYDLRWRDRHQGEDLVRWCLEMVERCQYFVGILGYRYGWRPTLDEKGNINSSRLSITEMEFRKALAIIPKNRRFFCVGDMRQYTADELAKENQEDIGATELLKKQLRELGEPVYEYRNFTELLEIIGRELQKCIDQEFDPAKKVPIELFTRKAALEAIVAEKVRGFVGRSKYLQQLHEFAQATGEKNYLAVHSTAGSGKSALLSRFIQEWKESHPDIPVIAHFLGMGGDSREVTGIMQSMGECLQELGMLENPLDPDPVAMRVQVRSCLEKVSRRLLLVLDGLDEVTESGRNLMWLSPVIPPNVRVVLTTRPGEPLDILCGYPRVQSCELPPMDDAEIAAIIHEYSQHHRLQLSASDQEILQKRASGNPLFLKVALDELASSGMAVGQLATTIESLFEQIIARLKKHFGADLIEDYLGLIAAGRMGMRESELYELLTIPKKEKLTEEFLLKVDKTLEKFVPSLQKLQQEYGQELVQDCLGLVAASRGGVPEDELRELLRPAQNTKLSDDFLIKVNKSLENFVILRSGLLTFFHPEFERAIKMSLGKGRMRGYHRRLAAYLRDKGYQYVRTLSELPYQEQWGEEYEALLKHLCDIEFLEKKCLAGMANGLAEDFHRALKESAAALPHGLSLAVAPKVQVNRETIEILDKAMTMGMQFIRTHPQSLFQTFWNYCYWRDCPEAKQHYLPKAATSTTLSPWEKAGNKIAQLMEVWRQSKEADADFVWFKSRRPIVPLGSALLKSLYGHEDEVWAVAVSANGQYVASASKDKTVQIWNSTSGESLRILRGHEKPVASVAFSPDGNRVVSASWDKTLRLWDTTSGECLKIFKGHDGAVTSVAISSDGNKLVSGAEDLFVKVWDIASGQCLQTLKGHKETVTTVAFGPQGDKVASGSEDHAAHIWDLASGACRQVLVGHANWVKSVAFHPAGNQLVTSSEDNTVKVWDVSSGQHIYTLTKKGVEREDSFANKQDEPERQEGQPAVLLRSQLVGEKEETVVNAALFSPDGNKIAIASSDRMIHVWDIAQEKYVQNWSGHAKSVLHLAWSQNGALVVSASSDKNVRIWDAASQEIAQTIIGHKDRITTLSFSPDQDKIATASYDETVRLWNANSGECLGVITGHHHLVSVVVFSPDGGKLATGSYDNTVKVWDLAKGKLLLNLDGHAHAIRDIAFSPDGTKLASASSDRTIRVWNLANGQTLHSLLGHKRDVLSVFFSGNGKYLISLGKDGSIRVWDPVSGVCLRILEGHQREVLAAALSPDQTQLASSSEDNTVRLWDVASGKCLQIFQGHEKTVYGVAFTPDGQRLISSADDMTVRTWEIATGQCLHVKKGYARADSFADKKGWRMVMSDQETWVERQDGTPVAFFPAALRGSTLSSKGVLADGNRLGYVYILEIRGKC